MHHLGVAAAGEGGDLRRQFSTYESGTGVSAVAIASLAIADLQRGGWHGEIRKPDGDGTSNVGSIHGGEATNVVTNRVLIKAEARSHDPRFRRRMKGSTSLPMG